ncbi:MAG: hypothetical protein DRI48_11510 [Chloroflexi bacterium]|nr:MAG: hypothetical protein DRI48_11510 [Chloroflexota bacterium]
MTTGAPGLRAHLAQRFVVGHVVVLGGVGRGLDVEQDHVGLRAGGVIVGDAEGLLLHRHPMDQFGQSRFVALERGLAAC